MHFYFNYRNIEIVIEQKTRCKSNDISFEIKITNLSCIQIITPFQEEPVYYMYDALFTNDI